MEWKIYEKWLDVTLYRQMTDLIYRLSNKKEKNEIYKAASRQDPLLKEPETDMETAYGLHYPGEVLERMEEHQKMTKQVYRALGLALARTLALQESFMFNGTQKIAFFKKLERSLGTEDLFFLSIRYLLEENNQRQWLDKLYQYPYQYLEEMVLALSVLPEDEKLWELLKGKMVKILETKQNLQVYEDWPVYVWIANTYRNRLKNHRKKDLNILKWLVKLSITNAKNADGALENQFQKLGYTVEEVTFLNFVMTLRATHPDHLLKQSLVMERLALNVLKTFLPGSVEYPQQAYELCSYILKTYQLLPVCIDGHNKIQECLFDILEVKNIQSFLVLYPFHEYGRKDWHYIDLLDSKWDHLAQALTREEFDFCVCETLIGKDYTKEELAKYLEKYKVLLGEDYKQVFWEKAEYSLQKVFKILSEKGMIDIIRITEVFIQSYKGNPDMFLKRKEDPVFNKWNCMMSYINLATEKIENENAFLFLKLVITESGMQEISSFLNPWNILEHAFSLTRYDIQRESCEIFRPFLSREEHRELFDWIEKHIFPEKTEEYPNFLIAILLQESTGIWMERKEAEELVKAVFPYAKDNAQKERLLEKYMTEEEKEQNKKKKEWLKEQQRRLNEWNYIKEIKEKFNQMLRESIGTAEEFKRLFDFYQNKRYSYAYEELYDKIAVSYTKDLMKRKKVIYVYREDLKYFLKLFWKLYLEENLEFSQLKDVFGRMEERKC